MANGCYTTFETFFFLVSLFLICSAPAGNFVLADVKVCNIPPLFNFLLHLQGCIDWSGAETAMRVNLVSLRFPPFGKFLVCFFVAGKTS